MIRTMEKIPRWFVLMLALLLTPTLFAGCDCGAGSIHLTIVGEMTVNPDRTPANGQHAVEVSITVYEDTVARKPVEGAMLQIVSSRNQGGATVDQIEQPNGPTNADGNATASLGSTTVGDAVLTVRVGKTQLCERYDNGQCLPLQKTVTFFLSCDSGQTVCGDQCADLNSDPNHCGDCNRVCVIPHADARCLSGQCAMGTCLTGWDDCNHDPADGCETDLQGDQKNCGSCGNACPQGLGCRNGKCSVACHDNDNDGYDDIACGGTDCNDSDPTVHPGAPEVCDGKDNDCNGTVDDDAPTAAACDDGDPCTVKHRCLNGKCVSQVLDADGDGYPPIACGGTDCDDNNPLVNPGMPEIGGVAGTCEDGIDNDCDGLTDTQEPGCNPCNTDADCSDHNACNGIERCSSSVCQPGMAVICADGNPCTDDKCDPTTGACIFTNNTKPCEDGNACTNGDTCRDGVCQPGSSLACDDGNPCTDDSCNPASGCVYVNNTLPCDDHNPCTQGDACKSGFCQPGSSSTDCDDGNPCTDDRCDPAAGCLHTPNDAACDDGNPCTAPDFCLNGDCHPGLVASCDDSNPCTDDTCDPATGLCLNVTNTRPCDDSNACTMDDTCNNGRCLGVPLDSDHDGFVAQKCGGNDCDDNDPNINPGVFEGPYDSTLCSDGIDNDCDGLTDTQQPSCLPCTQDSDCSDSSICTGIETCQTGHCVPGTPLDCDDHNPCTTDGCDPINGCYSMDNSDPCNDQNACTLNDTCQAGACVGQDQVVCDPLNQCHDAGICDPATGQCSNPVKPDGTTCNDGSLCTQSDTCQAGVCLGGNPVVCTPLDQCHDIGSCNPATGLCDNPNKADGMGCDDGNPCTRTDTCQSGTCNGSNPVICVPLDQCHDAGICDPAGGLCTNPLKPDGTVCDNGDLCFTSKSCQAGVCVGANPVVCTPFDQCHAAGVCNAATGTCSNPSAPDGTLCNDNNPCTQTDACQSGLCIGANPVVCAPSDQCHLAGTCNPATGTCSNPQKPDGSPCEDGIPCSSMDTCLAGSCRAGPTDKDSDHDGYLDAACPGGNDCNDNNPLANPGAREGPPGDPTCSDGLDNNCDGLTDMNDPNCKHCFADPDCDDSNVCTTDQCVGGNCVNTPVANGTPCNDANLCTQTDSCQGGTCTGTNPVVCTAMDQCHNVGTCNPASGICSNPPKADGTLCDDGNLCTRSDACQTGTCVGSNPVVCTPLDQCHVAGTCNPATGTCSNPAIADGSPCNDGNQCTGTDTCQAGSCIGSNPVVCTALDQCHNVGSCSPSTGLCSNPVKPDGASCNDGNLCTLVDTCQSGTCIGGSPVVCTALDQCHNVGTCNSTTGVCSNPNKPNGTPCNDGNPCSSQDTCVSGACTAGPTDKDSDGDGFFDAACPGGNDCDDTRPLVHPGATEGPPGNPTCSDTLDNNCNGLIDMADPGCAECFSHSDCNDNNACTTDLCVGGKCQHNPLANGTPCNDGNLCTQTDTCQSGTCTGSNPVVCTALDQCHDVGTCNPATGTCSNPVKPDGSACNDGSLCTQTDTCQAGTCTGSNPVVCAPLDQCHIAGTCNPATGTCSNPNKPDGTACNDGNLCTQTDTCQSGTCTGTNPVVCNPLDQCHTAGSCNPATGQCSNPTKPNGSPCDDGNLCTQTDTCQSGTCTGGNPVVCSPLDQCHNVGTCNPATGACSNPTKTDGTACNDGNLCTQTDTCQAGTCTGSNPVVCTPLDQCHTAGTCNPATGTCSNPNKPDGTACNDGNPCSTLDTCVGGTCTAGATNKDSDGDGYYDKNCPGGTDCDDTRAAVHPGAVEGPYGNPTCSDGLDNDCDGLTDMADTGCMQCQLNSDCNDNNVCTTDTCAGGVCQYIPVANGTGCNDGNLCTQTDTCQGGTCTGTNPVVCTALDQCHNVGTCNPATGTCSNPTKPDGTGCNDGSLCTQTDTCQSGTCTGSNPVVCTALDQCHNVGTCNPATGTCSNPTKPDGTSCTDGSLCTQTDTCQSGTCTGSNPVVCTALDQCHNIGTCNPATGTCSNPTKPDGTSCNDGNLCTQTDTCQSGTCTGGNPVVCTALDQCHNIGTCNPATGACSNPTKPDGTTCSDGNLCTQTDTCQSGTCTGGNPVVCTALDQCHSVGTCNPATGTCSNPNKPNGSACNDGQACTYPDTCQSGTCTGTPYSCDDKNPCTLDNCNGDGTCSHPNNPNYTSDPNFQYVETRCDGIDNDCDGCIDEGCPGYANPIIAAEVIPYTVGAGLRRLYGNGQFGPHSTELPNRLVVQLNDASGNPMPGQLVTFAVEAVNAVCLGDSQTQYACSDTSSDKICPMTLLKDCNDTLGVLLDDLGNQTTSLQVPTDANGQAHARLQLPTNDTGLTVVSAKANAQTVYFYAGSTLQLTNVITVPTSTNASPPTNPAFGPLIQTKWPNDSQAPTYMADFSSYTLAITALSATTGSTNGIPSAPLTAGGTLTITGIGFASPTGNTVWVGGVQATITAQSATSITIQIPEGLPGAAPVSVNDGSTTICKNKHGTADNPPPTNFGNLPSVATAPANFWRVATKPIYIFADTGSQTGSQANVKLLGLDVCGNPLPLTGKALTLRAYNPDKSTVSNAVTVVSGPDPTTGLATVGKVSSQVRAAVIIGTVNGMSSDSLVNGNTVVTAVPRTYPGTFQDMGIGNNNGVNSMIVRGADESNTQSRHLNPAIRLMQNTPYQSVWWQTYALTNTTETESNLWIGNVTGQGDAANLPTTLGVTYFTAVAGTGLGTISGGGPGADLGVLSVVSGRVGINPSLAGPSVFDVSSVIVPGWLHSPNAASQQECELNYTGIMFLDDSTYPPGYPRSMTIRIDLKRAMP